MSVQAEAPPQSQREWWLRAVLVLTNPRPVFSALRDESDEAVDARQEPVTALVFLAGISAVLLAPSFGHILDDYEIDTLGLLVIVVFAGSIYGFFSYWVLGWTLSGGITALHGRARARQCRHLLAYSTAPLVLSLVFLWPVRLAIYGGALFKDGGADSSVGGDVLRWMCVASAAWALGLLVYGVRTVERWSLARAAAATLLAVVLTTLVLAIWALIG